MSNRKILQTGGTNTLNIHARLAPPRLILASRSRGRKELMQKLRIPFECHTSGYFEDMKAHKSSAKLATFLALGKANFIAQKFPNSIIIGADTFITVGSKKIGKPKSIKDAREIISSMSGKTIHVHSGVAVIKTNAQAHITHTRTAHVLTKLTIKKMSPAEIDELAHAKEALEISGAFSIEGKGGKMIEKIDGDYDNVIGLPIFKLKEMLKNLTLKTKKSSAGDNSL